MTSKIVVNNIEADSGINTITFINEVTAPTFNGNIVGTAATFSGNVDIAGALTYEDVTNVDSVGIVTARSGIHVTGGSVGLGTDNPSQLLHLHSDSAHQILLKRGGQYPSECKFSNSGNLLTISNNKNGIHFDVGSSSLATAMYIEDGGNIGIGTDNPSVLLHLADTEPQFYIQDSNSVGNNVNATLQFRDSSNSQLSYFGYAGTSDSNLSLFNTMSGGALRLGTTGAERLRITSTGRVGINCTPLSQLQVKTGTNQNIALTSDGSEAAIEAYNDAGSANVPLRIRGSEIKFKIDGTQRARLYYSSNSAVLALGDESNSAGHIRLEAKASENQIHGRSNHPIAFLINTGEKLKLHTSGLLEGKGAQFTANVTPSSGRGVEIFEAGTGVGQIASFNRDGNGWDELRIKGSEVKIYAGTTNTLTLNIQSSQSTLYGTSDGILNLDTTDGRGAFIRFKENGNTKAWVGSAEGMGGGTSSPDQDDLGLRAVGNILFSSNGGERLRITENGRVLINRSTPTDQAINNLNSNAKLVVNGSTFTKHGYKADVGTSYVSIPGATVGNETSVFLVTVQGNGGGNFHSSATYILCSGAYNKTFTQLGSAAGHFGNGVVQAQLSSYSGTSSSVQVRRSGSSGTCNVQVHMFQLL